MASVEVMLSSVPLVMQFASPELAEDILYGGRAWTDDPRWHETGAPDLASYGRWAVRWCGMACLRMVLLARDGTAPSLYELAVGAQTYGAYSDEPGAPQGLIYRPFVDYLRAEHQLHADVATDFTVPALSRSVQDGNLVIASVHPEVRRPHRPSPGQGGHLVLVTAAESGTVTFNDPSGHQPRSRVATLPAATFERYFAKRGVILHV